MPTNQQRREAERRRLQRQLEERRAREQARRRFTLITSVVGTVAAIAAIVVIIVVASSGGGGKSQAGGKGSGTPTASATTSTPSAAPSSAVRLTPPAACAAPPRGTTAGYRGVTVGQAKNLKHEPKVTAKGPTTPSALECQDLVIGTGKPATAKSSVTIQYTGVLYKDGKQFYSSWSTKKPATFSLARVVPGFTQGIGGTGKVAPMRVGGRRIMILPPSLGYGPQANGPIPANSTLVFVVDLLKVA